ncbi:MAG: hypothetical protein HY744_18885 [Deltaproteobacteria bacterium]|nr:hypothetical protein [Deltaproteobacteria bacterium]
MSSRPLSPVIVALVALFTCDPARNDGPAAASGGAGGSPAAGGVGGGPGGAAGGAAAAGGSGGAGAEAAGAGGVAGAGGADAATCGSEHKWCNGQCVEVDDPAYGCQPNTCEPCDLLNAKAMCWADKCQIESCDPGFHDCDDSPPKDCEARLDGQPNPKAQAIWCGECFVTCGDGETCSPDDAGPQGYSCQ